MSDTTPLRFLVDRIEAFVPDRQLCGRLYADLTDMLEVCEWFVRTINGIKVEHLTRDELESLLIEIEGNMLRHMTYHLNSFGADLPAVLDAVGLPEDKDSA
jgi:hypothetical protein